MPPRHASVEREPQRLRERGHRAAQDLQLKMWLFPYLTWAAIISIVALLIGMVIVESTRESLLLSIALAVVVVAVGVLRYRRKDAAMAAEPARASEAAAPVE